jgi:GxxExxY protein
MSIEDPLTHAIIGCAMNVHNQLGNGFREVIYQRALEIELRDAGIDGLREQQIPIFYKNHAIGVRRADFLIDRRVLLELKAVIRLEDVHLAQALNYLVAYNLETGLLINFGAMKLEFKRLFRPRSGYSGGMDDPEKTKHASEK